MSELPAVMQTRQTNSPLSGWLRAYARFMFSKDESLLLKVAPLALIGVLPIDIVSNIVPGIGLLDDAGYVLLAAAVLYRTFSQVNTYRRAESITR